MADVKVLVGEVDGVDFDLGHERTLAAEDTDYDNTSSGLASTKVQGAIDELAASQNKLSFSLQLNINGNGNNSWFSLVDAGVPGNRVPWTPPLRMKLVALQFTNKNDGQNAGNPNVAQFAAYYQNIATIGGNNIQTTDPVEFTVNSTDPQVIQNGGDGRLFTFDARTLNLFFEPTRAYAFRNTRISGNQAYNDIHVTLWMEEA